MGKIEFKNCRVKINSKEQNYKDYTLDMDHVSKTEMIEDKKQCKVTMKDGTIIEIVYFGEPPLL